MIDADLWRELDGFHPDFFMYGEDADLCLRARAHGARPLIDPDATIIHYGGASERGVRAGKMIRLFTAKAQLYKKFWGAFAGRFGLFTLDLWTGVRCCAFWLLGLFGKGSPTSRESWREIWKGRSAWHAAFHKTRRYESAREGRHD
jgi:hypothetical protein